MHGAGEAPEARRTSSDHAPSAMGVALFFFLGLAFIESVKERATFLTGSFRKSARGAE